MKTIHEVYFKGKNVLFVLTNSVSIEKICEIVFVSQTIEWSGRVQLWLARLDLAKADKARQVLYTHKTQIEPILYCDDGVTVEVDGGATIYVIDGPESAVAALTGADQVDQWHLAVRSEAVEVGKLKALIAAARQCRKSFVIHLVVENEMEERRLRSLRQRLP